MKVILVGYGRMGKMIEELLAPRGDVEILTRVGTGKDGGLLLGQTIFAVQAVGDHRQRLHRLGRAAIVYDVVGIADGIEHPGIFIHNDQVAEMRQIQGVSAIFSCDFCESHMNASLWY